MDDSEQARAHRTRRYLELVDALGEELGGGYGWKAKVARVLGISRSYLSRLMKGNRQVGSDAITLAMSRLKLQPGFFEADSGDYLDQLGTHRALWEPNDPEAFKAPKAGEGRWVDTRYPSKPEWDDEELLDAALAFLRAKGEGASDEQIGNVARTFIRVSLAHPLYREPHRIREQIRSEDAGAREEALRRAE